MKLEKISADKIKDVVEHHKRSFYCNDPVHLALGVCDNDESMKEEIEMAKKTIEEGMSVMAVADGKIVGAHINGMMCPGTAERELAAPSNPVKPFDKIKFLKAKANEKVNLFERYNVNSIYDIKMVSADEDFQCPNVGFQEIKLDEQIAREAGYKVSSFTH